MLDDGDQIAAVLAPTLIGGRPVVEIPMVGADQLAFAVECEPGEILPAWEAARSVLHLTGRWPLVVRHRDRFSGPGWLARLAAARAEAVRHLAEMRYATGDHTLGRPEWTVDVPPLESALAEAMARLAEQEVEPDDLVRELDRVAARFAAAPAEAEVIAALGNRPRRLDLERWLLAWESARAPAGGAPDAGYLEWFEPHGDQPAVVLAPVARGWDTLVDFPFIENAGELGGGVGRLVAVVWSWHERFGAELVANWGTVLQFLVGRPPPTVEDAWPLALEQVAVAPCTIELSAVPLRHHARALVGRPTWLLRESR